MSAPRRVPAARGGIPGRFGTMAKTGGCVPETFSIGLDPEGDGRGRQQECGLAGPGVASVMTSLALANPVCMRS